MTSLQILPKPVSHINTSAKPVEWGTGSGKAKVPLWTPRPPTWHLSGRPVSQQYRLTELKKSNLRMNDQLLPKPQEYDMSQGFIEKPFPANHPYTSHMNKFAVFPSFATTPEDPTRGVDARASLPLSSETPAHPYDIQIVSKVKGFPRRHEIQSLPSGGLKRGLSWCGEKDFDQLTKTGGGDGRNQRFYPHPTQQVMPNLVTRSVDRAITPATANATRNVERMQWNTTYDRQFTGLGPSAPLELNNLEGKEMKRMVTGSMDDELWPTHKNTFDPARPYEGRISDEIRNKHQLMLEGAKQYDTDHSRRLTLTEKEDNRLLNGQNYLDLPQGRAPDEVTDPYVLLMQERFSSLSGGGENPSPYSTADVETAGEREALGGKYMGALRAEERERVQQIEAHNRWKILEAQNPGHAISSLTRKYDVSTESEKPDTFYGHEGRYNEERAGLYHTSYNPQRLAATINKTTTEMKFDTAPFRPDNVALTGELDLDPFLVTSSTHAKLRGAPQLSDRPSVYEVFGPHDRDRAERENLLTPSASRARGIIQDGRPVIQTIATEQGESYNTAKFLSEHALHSSCRSEPMALMSAENQNLNNARLNSFPLTQEDRKYGIGTGSLSRKSVRFDERVSLAPAGRSEPLRVSQSHIENPQVALTSPRTPRQNGYQGQTNPCNYSEEPAMLPPPVRVKDLISDEGQTHHREYLPKMAETGNPRAVRRTQSLTRESVNGGVAPVSMTMVNGRGAFHSHSTNVMPSVSADFMFQRDGDVEGTAQHNLQSKQGERFDWASETGTPRPQTSLLKLQNSFSRSGARQTFHNAFKEISPNLIRNLHTGKKHSFELNSQVLRGAAA